MGNVEAIRLDTNPFARGANGARIRRPVQRALGEVIRHVGLETPVLVVSGGPGTGKTLLVEMAMRACSDMGLTVLRFDRGDLVHLSGEESADVLIVDEADSITAVGLDMLQPIEGTRPATSVVLLCLPSSVARFQRATDAAVIEIPQLSAADARNYLIDRGSSIGRADLFTPAALDLLIEASRGLPRVLRSAAGLAFFSAATDGASQISREHVIEVLGQITFELNEQKSVAKPAASAPEPNEKPAIAPRPAASPLSLLTGSGGVINSGPPQHAIPSIATASKEPASPPPPRTVRSAPVAPPPAAAAMQTLAVSTPQSAADVAQAKPGHAAVLSDAPAQQTAASFSPFDLEAASIVVARKPAPRSAHTEMPPALPPLTHTAQERAAKTPLGPKLPAKESVPPLSPPKAAAPVAENATSAASHTSTVVEASFGQQRRSALSSRAAARLSRIAVATGAAAVAVAAAVALPALLVSSNTGDAAILNGGSVATLTAPRASGPEATERALRNIAPVERSAPPRAASAKPAANPAGKATTAKPAPATASKIPPPSEPDSVLPPASPPPAPAPAETQQANISPAIEYTVVPEPVRQAEPETLVVDRLTAARRAAQDPTPLPSDEATRARQAADRARAEKDAAELAAQIAKVTAAREAAAAAAKAREAREAADRFRAKKEASREDMRVLFDSTLGVNHQQ